MLIFNNCATIPPLTIVKIPSPKIASGKAYEKLLSYNSFLLLPTTKGKEITKTINITTDVNPNLYSYDFGQITAMEEQFKKVLKDVRPDIIFVEKNALPIILQEKELDMSGLTDSEYEQISNLKSVDAIMQIHVDYIRNQLTWAVDGKGGWITYQIPTLSASIKVVSVSTRELLASTSISLDGRMFLNEPKVDIKVNEPNPFYMWDFYMQVASYYLIQDFMNPEQAWIKQIALKYRNSNDMANKISDLK